MRGTENLKMSACPASLPSAQLPSATGFSIARLNSRILSLVVFALALALNFTARAQAPASDAAPAQAPDAAQTQAPNPDQSTAPASEAKPNVPDPGSISGTVVDEAGKPVDRATVQLYDGFGLPIRLRTVHTDQYGHFVAYTLHPGEWALFPSKVEDGYADQVYGIGINRAYKPQHVVVKTGAETSGVVVLMPPKAATIHIETIDADTGQPIKFITIRVENLTQTAQAPGQGAPLMVHGENSVHSRKISPADILIAPGVVRMTVTSAGYETWTASENNRQLLALRAGDHRVFQLKLHALSRASATVSSRPTRQLAAPPSPASPATAPPAAAPQAAPAPAPAAPPAQP
jgi:hypothetical protein